MERINMQLEPHSLMEGSPILPMAVTLMNDLKSTESYSEAIRLYKEKSFETPENEEVSRIRHDDFNQVVEENKDYFDNLNKCYGINESPSPPFPAHLFSSFGTRRIMKRSLSDSKLLDDSRFIPSFSPSLSEPSIHHQRVVATKVIKTLRFQIDSKTTDDETVGRRRRQRLKSPKLFRSFSKNWNRAVLKGKVMTHSTSGYFEIKNHGTNDENLTSIGSFNPWKTEKYALHRCMSNMTMIAPPNYRINPSNTSDD